ncbi:serine/threonine-protein kinase PLK4 [Chelonus insularis]|uniref:serine/threonine-protein kinase PLK4 n=1 Tax=Chelonus insularis TaxID=460826 RepID=UPI001589001E|nr:serine/threonine-protein kinase PLK4 [Chelonus insularis]
MPPVSSGFGKHIEEYKVLNFLGKGGFAVVYRAKCLRTNTEVAIKMIDKKLMEASGMVGRVNQEVAIHSRLKHPAILELYTCFQDTHYVYLVLELCHNGELQHYLKTHYPKGLPENRAAKFIKQVVQGLLYLHSHQILHRDLSLSNLLLTSDLHVKIADFGLATQLSNPNEKHMTMCGTPNYISPEVATRSSHGLEADVWGLGCMLYTLLVGKPPFDTDAVKSTLTRVVMADYIIPKYLSDNAKDLIERLLRKNPKERIKLRDIIKHPFITSIDQQNFQEKTLSNKVTFKDSGLVDSGLGRTLSSLGQTHRRGRSRSEERTSCISSHLLTPATPYYTTRSDPAELIYSIKEHDNLGHERLRNTNFSHGKKSISSNILHPPPAQMISKSSQHHNGDVDHEKNVNNVDHQKSDKPKCREQSGKSHNYLNGTEANTKLQVPPLNTKRLLPIRHKAKSVVFTILENGEVCIEFTKKKNITERVSEVCRISGDGLRIILYKLREMKPIGDTPPPVPSSGADNIYSYESLPTRHHRKYLYAARFINLIKAKTPKLSLYTGRAKCNFMENGPHPDCEVLFYDGTKVNRVDSVVKITNTVGDTYEDKDLPKDLEEYYEHYEECYQRCLLLESALSSLETATGHSSFPVIIGRRPLAALNNSAPSQGKENMSRVTAYSPPMMPSFDATCSVVSGMTTRSKKTSLRSMPNTYTNKINIPGLGVTTQLPSGEVKVEFKDGTALIMSPQNYSSGIQYVNQYGMITKYSTNHHQNTQVPYDVREKLKYVPTVLKYLVQSQHESIR